MSSLACPLTLCGSRPGDTALATLVEMLRRAVVLGGGGVTGVAWEVGLLLGLAEAGVDLGPQAPESSAYRCTDQPMPRLRSSVHYCPSSSGTFVPDRCARAGSEAGLREVRIQARRTPAACSPPGGPVARRASHGHPEHRPLADQLIRPTTRSSNGRRGSLRTSVPLGSAAVSARPLGPRCSLVPDPIFRTSSLTDHDAVEDPPVRPSQSPLRPVQPSYL
jgi:hypothetical protein